MRDQLEKKQVIEMSSFVKPIIEYYFNDEDHSEMITATIKRFMSSKHGTNKHLDLFASLRHCDSTHDHMVTQYWKRLLLLVKMCGNSNDVCTLSPPLCDVIDHLHSLHPFNKMLVYFTCLLQALLKSPPKVLYQLLHLPVMKQLLKKSQDEQFTAMRYLSVVLPNMTVEDCQDHVRDCLEKCLSERNSEAPLHKLVKGLCANPLVTINVLSRDAVWLLYDRVLHAEMRKYQTALIKSIKFMHRQGCDRARLLQSFSTVASDAIAEACEVMICDFNHIWELDASMCNHILQLYYAFSPEVVEIAVDKFISLSLPKLIFAMDVPDSDDPLYIRRMTMKVALVNA